MKTNSLSLLSLVALLVLCTAGALVAAPRRAPLPHVRPPEAHSYGRTLEEWAEFWCQRKVSFLQREQEGEVCDYGQLGSVWFLADGTETQDEFHTNLRECVVPEGAALFFPIDDALVFSDPLSPLSDDELRARSSLSLSYNTNRHCEIDGRPIQNLERYRRQTPVFPLAWPGAGDVPAGTYPAVADGYWIFLAPLPVGNHTIHVVTGAPGSDYYVDLLIRLTIVPAAEFVPPDPGSD